MFSPAYAAPLDKTTGHLRRGLCNETIGYAEPSESAIDCATLRVPLDYTEPESTEFLDLNLIRVPATRGASKGSLLFNFGGPGDSGVEVLALHGNFFQT